MVIQATVDEALGIVRTLSVGFSGDEEVREYADTMLGLMASARRRGKPFLHLVDATQAQVHTREAAAMLNGLANEWHDPLDRTAVIMKSSLLKMQMQRTNSSASAATFASEAEAIDWLLSPSVAPYEPVRAS